MATDTVPLPTRHGGETPARPLWLLAELTYACPLQCPYCSNPTEMARIGREIDTEAWKKVLRQARAMGAAQLGLSGGEPLVRRDLEEIVAEGRRLGYYSNLITSGIGMNDDRVAALAEAGLDHIQISFQASNAEMNNFLGGTDSFEKKKDMARAIKRHGYPMVLNIVLHRKNIDDIEEIIALGESQQKRMTAQLDIQVGEITRIEHIGMGHRACIDVTSLMTREEGMLVGSTSSGGLLACSETHPLPYMDLRPFRVNAGAIHSYVWCPNNKTHYLSELKAGSKVFCVNVNGAAREVTVGRIKTEVRPLLLLEAKCGDVVVNAIVQDDWHVRVYGGDGEPVSVTTFQPGDPVLCYITKPGRHVGLPVDEQIIER